MRMKKRIGLLLALSLIISMIPAPASAALKSPGEPTEVQSLVSSERLEHNWVKINANGTSLQIEAETSVKAAEYNFNVIKADDTKSVWVGRAYPSDMGNYCKFSFTLPSTTSRTGTMSGDYILQITKKVGAKNNPVIYKNCAFRVTSGSFSILQYDKIIEENNRIDTNADKKKKPSSFKKTNLSDVKSVCFRDPVTKKVASVTKKKVNYFKTVSNKVVKGADSDYEKLLKIYEYVAGNFYYDNIAFSTKTKQYVDPYRNLYNLRNKKKSANSQGGKVATTCVGYSAIVCALARAQGIPTRIVNGHHITLNTSDGYNTWSTESSITVVGHWWNECYVDGRWITVDATAGNSNKWNRNTNTWTYTGLTNYTYFDPTDEQLATSHMLLAVKGL